MTGFPSRAIYWILVGFVLCRHHQRKLHGRTVGGTDSRRFPGYGNQPLARRFTFPDFGVGRALILVGCSRPGGGTLKDHDLAIIGCQLKPLRPPALNQRLEKSRLLLDGLDHRVYTWIEY